MITVIARLRLHLRRHYSNVVLGAVRAEAGGVRQPEGELHDGGDPREGRERQPAGVRAAHLPHADHGGGRPQPAQACPTGHPEPHSIIYKSSRRAVCRPKSFQNTRRTA